MEIEVNRAVWSFKVSDGRTHISNASGGLIVIPWVATEEEVIAAVVGWVCAHEHILQHVV